MRRGLIVAVLGLVAWKWASADGPPAAAGSAIGYNRDIRPILAENCFRCHGPDSAARKADLRLDLRDEAIKAGAIVPGKVEESALVERVFSEDADQVMPPPKSHKKLTAAEKDLLKRWVAAGAEYQSHWSYIAPIRPYVPEVHTPRGNPIDAFVRAELQKHGLAMAPEADRRTLARRLAFDLTGLPPEPADVEAFVNDTDSNWYEKYVDKLMASSHWGEHRARYWLDVARYADTHGIHFDNFREMWSYRDWVISAFNQNIPFDRFTVEQLAGDLLPNATLDQQVASGFNRCNITTNEGGAINEEYLVLYTRDRTETTAAVWLGMTAGCAVCHDHKFDPLSQREFYAMAAFFNNTTQNAMDGNVHNTPPIINLPKAEDRPRFQALTKEIKAFTSTLAARKQTAKPEFEDWLAHATPDELGGAAAAEGMIVHLPLEEGQGRSARVIAGDQVQQLDFGDGVAWLGPKEGRNGLVLKSGYLKLPEAGDFEKDQAFAILTWVRPTKRGLNGALLARMDESQGYRGWDVWMQNDRVGSHIINTWPGDALKVVCKNPLQLNKWQHVAVTYDGSGTVAGLRIFVDGQPQPVDVEAATLHNSIRAATPLRLGRRSHGQGVQNIAVQDLRLYARKVEPSEVGQLAKSSRAADILAKPPEKRSTKEKDELYQWWLITRDEPTKLIETRLAELKQEEAAIRSRGTIAHVMQEKRAEPMAFVLNRGEYDQRRDPVKPDTPKILPPFPANLPHNRIGFAQWLLRPDHPLTARVTVNRFWQELFGQGLVRSAGDFGTTGEMPSHPQLLDWLAVEFRESGWDMKKLFKLMVMSDTYRQSAVVTPEKLQKDPQNRLLSRGPRFRMDAEMIRDQALAVSGLLVRKIGGPSVKPYQPEGVWEAVAMIGSNTRDYKRDTGEALYRRGLYTFWKRAAPPASLDVLNAPNRETCSVKRERTNTPLQALVTLNDIQYVEAARHLATNALKQEVSDEATFDWLSRRLLARPFRPAEIVVVQKSLAQLVDHYRQHADDARKLIAVGESKPDAKLDPAQLAAWTMLCNQLMNLDEVLNK